MAGLLAVLAVCCCVARAAAQQTPVTAGGVADAGRAGNANAADNPAGSGVPPWMLLFGDEHDPTRPIKPDPQPAGRGIVRATLVVAGAAQVLEYQGEAKDLSAAVIDVRIEAGSTTPDFTAASVRGLRAQGAPAAQPDAALLGLCVVSKDAAVKMTIAAGTRRSGWTVHVADHEFACADSWTRLAVLPGGSFRLSASSAADGGARLVVVFAAPPEQWSAVALPGVTVELAAKVAQ